MLPAILLDPRFPREGIVSADIILKTSMRWLKCGLLAMALLLLPFGAVGQVSFTQANYLMMDCRIWYFQTHI